MIQAVKPFQRLGGAPGGTWAGGQSSGGSSRWARFPSAQPRRGLGLLLLAQLQPRVF